MLNICDPEQATQEIGQESSSGGFLIHSSQICAISTADFVIVATIVKDAKQSLLTLFSGKKRPCPGMAAKEAVRHEFYHDVG